MPALSFSRVRLKKIFLAAALMALALPAMLSQTGAKILNKRHDIAGRLGTHGMSCQFCHSPVRKSLPNLKWVSSGVPARYPQYTANGGPGWESSVCLGCHDGAVAMEASPSVYGGHPVSFTYANSPKIRSGGIEAPQGNYVTGKVSGVRYPLFNGRMECITVHSVHIGEDTTLRVPAAIMCFDCHLNK
ncbi:MAG: hypothetical protein M0Z59_08180 [Nitrospiraceae bacterium]|nr:hypothetical protein [Nitrospiraceae bacterium]